MKNKRENEIELDREWLADELSKADRPELPSSLSAAALFARMDAEDAEAAKESASSPAPEKKGNVIRIQWRRWGSIAAVLVLAVGISFLLKDGALANKGTDLATDIDVNFSMGAMQNNADDRELCDIDGNIPAEAPDGLMMAPNPNPNPSTAGIGNNSEAKKESLTSGAEEDVFSRINPLPGEQPTPDLNDLDAMASVSSQLFGSDYAQVYAMFYDSGDRWEACMLPQSCAHYFLLDKTLYGFFPEERRVVNYREECATVLNEDEAAMLSAILQIEFAMENE